MESIDYGKLYCDFRDQDFLASLQLSDAEVRTLFLLTGQASEDNRCYIPQLQIEALTEAPGTPYQALRSLHNLKQKRIIFYGLAEEIPNASSNAPTDIIDKVLHKAVEEATGDEAEGAEKYVGNLGREMQRRKSFDRYAVLNVEYPVIFNCMDEESAFHEQWNPDDLQLLYTAIRANKLVYALEKCKLNIIAEFLHYVQSLFNQPLSVVEPEPTPEPDQVAEAESVINKQYEDWENGNEAEPNA